MSIRKKIPFSKMVTLDPVDSYFDKDEMLKLILALYVTDDDHWLYTSRYFMKMKPARAMWRMVYGPVLPGHRVIACTVEDGCINPNHCKVLTDEESMRQRVEKLKASGAKLGRPKLIYTVKDIRRLFNRPPHLTVPAIAAQLHLSEDQVKEALKPKWLRLREAGVLDNDHGDEK